MTSLPSLELLPPGTRPTEPGWYVRRLPAGDCDVVEIALEGDGLYLLTSGNEIWQPMDESHADFIGAKWLAFIARIYPDRIGQE